MNLFFKGQSGYYYTNNITSNYVFGLSNIKKEIRTNEKSINIRAKGNNLKNINIKIPLGLLCCITGVSGSGKSLLLMKYCTHLNKYFKAEKNPLEYDNLMVLKI